MPEKRQLNSGVTLSRELSVFGEGYVYYVDAGPEGKIKLWDSFLTEPKILAAVLAWDLDDAVEEPRPTLKPTFENYGCRL